MGCKRSRRPLFCKDRSGSVDPVNGQGANILGKLLMELRSEERESRRQREDGLER